MDDEWREHLRKAGAKGGNATKKKYGKKHFSAMGKSKRRKKKS